MTRPSVNPGPVADEAPTEPTVTDYDRLHLITYLILLDAVRDGIDRKLIMLEVLQIDPDQEPLRALRSYKSHLARAEWMTREGYRYLLDTAKDAG